MQLTSKQFSRLLGYLQRKIVIDELVFVGYGRGLFFDGLDLNLINKSLLIDESFSDDSFRAKKCSSNIIYDCSCVSDAKGIVVFYSMSNPMLSGFVSCDNLLNAWSNCEELNSKTVETQRLDTIVSSYCLSLVNWLVIDCVSGIDILKSATHLVDALDVLIITSLSDSLNAPNSSNRDIVAYCQNKDYVLLVSVELHHPDYQFNIFVKQKYVQGRVIDKFGYFEELLSFVDGFVSVNKSIDDLVRDTFMSNDLLDAIDNIVLSDHYTKSDKCSYLLAISDKFKSASDVNSAINFVNQIVDLGLISDERELVLVLQKLLELNANQQVLDLFFEHFISSNRFSEFKLGTFSAIMDVYQSQQKARSRSSGHGHVLLLSYLDKHIDKLMASQHQRVLIEIGTTRELVPGQGSTKALAQFCFEHGIHFITVDMDPHNTRFAQALFDSLSYSFQAVNAKGEDFLRHYQGTIDFIFLDAYDFDHGKHTELRQSRYEKYLGERIIEEQCHKMHLDCAESITQKLSDDGVICFDDTWLVNGKWVAKGTLAMPYLLDHQFKVVDKRNNAALLVKDM